MGDARSIAPDFYAEAGKVFRAGGSGYESLSVEYRQQYRGEDVPAERRLLIGLSSHDAQDLGVSLTGPERAALGAFLSDPRTEEERATTDGPPAALDAAHLARQARWSERTFGPGRRTAGIVAHITKELDEVRAAPDDLGEWVDVVILGLDGAWRTGATPQQIVDAVRAKQARNEARTWPDWRRADPDAPIEHDRTGEPTTTGPAPEGMDDDARKATVKALYDYLFETDRYLSGYPPALTGHDECCPVALARAERRQEERAALQERRAVILRALAHHGDNGRG